MLSREAEEAGDSFKRGELSLSSGRQEEMLAQDGGELHIEADAGESESIETVKQKHDEL